MIDISLIIILAVLLISTIIRYSFGFGFALVAMPLLTLFTTLKMAAILTVLISLTIACIMLVEDWRHIHFSCAKQLIIASLIGIPFGLLLLNSHQDTLLKAILGIIIISFSIYSMIKPKCFSLINDQFASIAGFFSGVLTGAFGSGGPPIVIYSQLRNWSPETFKSTFQSTALISSLFCIASQSAIGFLSQDILKYYLFSLPLVLLGIIIGKRLNRYIHKNFDLFIYLLLISTGTTLLVECAI